METLQKLTHAINSKINLESFSHEFYYNSIALCMIDAVFSIGVKYAGVKNVIERFCKHENITKYRAHGSPPESAIDEYTVEQLIDFYVKNQNDYVHIAENIYQNSCRTSSVNGILKAQAVYDFAVVLKEYNVNKMVDVLVVQEREAFEGKVKLIRGQSSGIMLKYFYMLCGYENIIKPDRHILEFIRESTGEDLQSNHDYALTLIQEYVTAENQKGRHYTCGLIDGAIWKYMSERENS